MKELTTISTDFKCFIFFLFWVYAGICYGEGKKKSKVSEDEEVKVLFREGVKKYDEGDYESALEKFKEAYSLKQNPKILYNIGWCNSKLGNNVEAIKVFEKFLIDGKDNKELEGMIEEAKNELGRLRKLVGKVIIEEKLSGVEVKIGEVVLGKTPIEGVHYFEAGKYAVSAQKEGFKPYKEEIEIHGGEEVRLVFNLKPLPKEEPSAIKQLEEKKQPKVGTLVLTSNKEGFSLSVDGSSKGVINEGTRKIILSEGRHILKGELEGFEEIESEIFIKGGEKREIEFIFKPKKGKMRVNVNIDGAKITINDKEIGNSPLIEPVLLERGSYKVRVFSDGMLPWEGEVEIKPEEERIIDVELIKNKKGLKAFFATSLSLGIASYIVMAGFGFKADSLKNDYEDLKDQGPRPEETEEQWINELQDTRDKGIKYQKVSDVFLGLGSAFMVCAIIGLAYKPFEKKSKAKVALGSEGISIKW